MEIFKVLLSSVHKVRIEEFKVYQSKLKKKLGIGSGNWFQSL